MMKYKYTKFQIAQLRQQNLIGILYSIVAFVATLFTSAFLPSILLRYYFANQQLTQEPKIFEYIQTGAFVVGVAYFLYAMLVNLKRSVKIRQLEKEMADMMSMDDGACCGSCGGDCQCDSHSDCACGCDMEDTQPVTKKKVSKKK